jgi:DNA-binding transcriptional LysR family regulator
MKQSDVDLNALSTLALVVNSGSFSAAARRLGVPANRVSRKVQALEKMLGVRLLQRTTRSLSMTSAGQAIMEEVEPALAKIESIWRDASAQSDEPRGHLRIAAPADLLSVFSSEKLAEFLDKFPKVSVEICLSDDVVDLVDRGFDMAFRVGPIKDGGLVARQLASSRQILVASPSFLRRYGSPKNINAVCDLPCLSLRSKAGTALWKLNGPRGLITLQVSSRLTVNGMGALVSAAQAGLGIAMVPERLAKPLIANKALIRVLPKFCDRGSGIYAVYPSRKNQPAALRVFLDFVFAESQGLLD